MLAQLKMYVFMENKEISKKTHFWTVVQATVGLV